MDNCIFCKITKGEIPCDKIYEDKDFFVFLDASPVYDGHLLIVPKKHIKWMQEADDEIISSIFVLTKKIMIAMKKAMECDYVEESVVGEEVPHFHIHLIPRYFSIKFPKLPRKKYKDGESSLVAKKLIEAL